MVMGCLINMVATTISQEEEGQYFIYISTLKYLFETYSGDFIAMVSSTMSLSNNSMNQVAWLIIVYDHLPAVICTCTSFPGGEKLNQRPYLCKVIKVLPYRRLFPRLVTLGKNKTNATSNGIQRWVFKNQYNISGVTTIIISEIL